MSACEILLTRASSSTRKLSYDLLVTIFNPSTPLHDGAVIIQRERIAAASCFLPLTKNPSISRELGTRHRAAIGVTEDTDAISIVVSEETGLISFIDGGRLKRYLDTNQLRGLLLKRDGYSRHRKKTRADQDDEGSRNGDHYRIVQSSKFKVQSFKLRTRA